MKGGDDVLTSDMQSGSPVHRCHPTAPGRALQFWQAEPISFKEKKTQGGSLCPNASELLRHRAEARNDVQHCRSQPDSHTAQMEKGRGQCFWQYYQHVTGPSQGEA